MSTQRRENRRQLGKRMEDAKGLSRIWLGFIAWFVRAMAAVGTAPVGAILQSRTPRLATNFLQLGHLNTQLVRRGVCRLARCAPPVRAARNALSLTPATGRSSLPLTPAPSVLDCLLPCLPHNGSPGNFVPLHSVQAAFS